MNRLSAPAGSSRFASQISMSESLSNASSSLPTIVSLLDKIAVHVISCSETPGVRISPSFVAVLSASFVFLRLFSVVKAMVAPSVVFASLSTRNR